MPGYARRLYMFFSLILIKIKKYLLNRESIKITLPLLGVLIFVYCSYVLNVKDIAALIVSKIEIVLAFFLTSIPLSFGSLMFNSKDFLFLRSISDPKKRASRELSGNFINKVSALIIQALLFLPLLVHLIDFWLSLLLLICPTFLSIALTPSLKLIKKSEPRILFFSFIGQKSGASATYLLLVLLNGGWVTFRLFSSIETITEMSEIGFFLLWSTYCVIFDLVYSFAPISPYKLYMILKSTKRVGLYSLRQSFYLLVPVTLASVGFQLSINLIIHLVIGILVCIVGFDIRQIKHNFVGHGLIKNIIFGVSIAIPLYLAPFAIVIVLGIFSAIQITKIINDRDVEFELGDLL